MTNEQGGQNWRPNEGYSFTIAIVIIVSFVVFFGYALFYKDADTLQLTVGLFSGYVAAVLTYYLGQRQVQALSGRIDTAQAEATRARESEETLKSEARPFVQETGQEIELIKERIDAAMNLVRERDNAIDVLEKQLEELRKENIDLEEKLQALEGGSGGVE